MPATGVTEWLEADIRRLVWPDPSMLWQSTVMVDDESAHIIGYS